jgi:hypothetical protein
LNVILYLMLSPYHNIYVKVMTIIVIYLTSIHPTKRACAPHIVGSYHSHRCVALPLLTTSLLNRQGRTPSLLLLAHLTSSFSLPLSLAVHYSQCYSSQHISSNSQCVFIHIHLARSSHFTPFYLHTV